MDKLEELTKEVYAHFGLAYYHSDVLHKGLCNIYACLTFKDVEDITSPRVEEKYQHSYSLTLGKTIDEIKLLLPSEFHEKLETALEKRNYLAHRFWYERCLLMMTEEGLNEMREELLELTHMFMELDEAITKFVMPKFHTVGITDEIIQKSYNELINKQKAEPLVSQRFLKKQERIIRVWNVKTGDKSQVQIFQTEDGCLWQLSDIGLGWTRYEKPSEDWIIYESVQMYLPAIINPRPQITEPWNYEFKLDRGASLQIRRGKNPNTYSLRIKKPS